LSDLEAGGRIIRTKYDTIRFERRKHIGTLTLARPEKRNAQSPLMWQEISALGRQLAGDPSLRCLVVAGQGASFSAGIDLVDGLQGTIAEFADGSPDEQTVERGLGAAGTFAWIPKLGCPSVAAVQGHAYGAGLQLALSCDFRIFAASARVGLLETRFGLMPDMGATVRLPRIVGEAHARELILLGEIIDANEALRIGLANRVVDDDAVSIAAHDLAQRLSAQPPVAIRGARRALDAAWYRDSDTSFRIALEAQIDCLRSEDFKEARRALGEGREPEWQGR
jgi:enoyl-CoA hydratase/carnithine racemase